MDVGPLRQDLGPAETEAIRVMGKLAEAMGHHADVSPLLSPDYVLDNQLHSWSTRSSGAAPASTPPRCWRPTYRLVPLATHGERLAL